MSSIIALVTEVFAFLFVSYDGVATDGAVVAMANVIISNALLVLPIILMLVGLVVGVFRRIVSAVRG